MKRIIAIAMIMVSIVIVVGIKIQEGKIEGEIKVLEEEYKVEVSKYLESTGEKIAVEEIENIEGIEGVLEKEDDDLTDLVFKVQDVIGKIHISRISCNILILEGVQEEQLKYGAGHMPTTALPGERGNCVIMGHRNYTFGQYFNRLNELEIGDKILITTYEKEYKYVVENSFVVEPEEVWVTNWVDENMLTLITCHPIIIGNKRLIIQAYQEK